MRTKKLITPAREGTLRVLRAARERARRRVVMTSVVAAIGYGQRPQTTPFTEMNWTNPRAKGLQPYAKSKTLAEHEAWKLMGRERGRAGTHRGQSGGRFSGRCWARTIRRRFWCAADDGWRDAPVSEAPLGVVDVRDVADLHLRAMTHLPPVGERFLAVSGDFMSIQENRKRC